jgi:hypothetical protein
MHVTSIVVAMILHHSLHSTLNDYHYFASLCYPMLRPFIVKRHYHGTHPRPFWRMLKDILQGDDHRNPQKILERNYLYLTLLLTEAKQQRITTREAAASFHSFDTLTNAQLRQEVQRRLEPDLMTILHAFNRVDATLDTQNIHELQRIVNQEIGVTENELIRVQNQTDDDSAKRRQEEFLQRKKSALQLLLYPEERPTERIDGFDALGTDLAKVVSEDTLARIRSFQLINACRSAKIKKELGYSLWILPSLIPNAGRGCFVDGKVPLGSLIAFQPGEVWCKEHLVTSDPEVMHHFDDGDEDCQISLRFDDYVIDSRNSPVIVLNRKGSMNPWALGHMVNHPPADGFPNCHCSMLNYTERTFQSQEQLVKYIPNSYARPLGWQSQFFLPEPILMHGLCLVSRRDLENEELLYDYRLQSEETPEWYSIVRYGDDTLDNEQVVFFRDDWRNK